MPNSTSPLSYNDIKEVLDKALDRPRGLQLDFKSAAEAVRWVSRANSFRTIDRKANAKLYHEGHSMQNSSLYDVLLIAREDKAVTILTRTTEGLSVTEL